MRSDTFETAARYAAYLVRLSRQPRTFKISHKVGANLDQECARRRRQISREGGRTHYGNPIWELDPRNPRRIHGH